MHGPVEVCYADVLSKLGYRYPFITLDGIIRRNRQIQRMVFLLQ